MVDAGDAGDILWEGDGIGRIPMLDKGDQLKHPPHR